MAIITKQQLEQASTDANLLNIFVHGSKDQTIPTVEGLKPTIAGITEQALKSASIDTMDGFSFVTGATLTLNNQALVLPSNGQYYRWSGSIPTAGIVVPAGSTPTDSGGIGPGKWLSVGDASLRSDLLLNGDSQGAEIVGYESDIESAKSITVKDKLSQIPSTFDAVSIQSILTSGKDRILCDSESYSISSDLTIPENSVLIISSGFSVNGAKVTNNGNIVAPFDYSAGIPYPKGFKVKASDGNVYESITPCHNDDPVTDTGYKWKMAFCLSPVNLLVPSRFANINQALSFIKDASLSAIVTIKVSSHSSPAINFTNKNGEFIVIDGTNRNTILNFGTNDGIAINGPFKLNIRNVTLTGSNWTSHGVYTKVTNGIYAASGGFANCYNVFITKIYYGFQAARGGSVYMDTCEVSEAGDGGVFAFNGGVIDAINCTSHDNYDNGLIGQLGYGFVAEDGGKMWLRNPVSYGCPAAIFCNINSSIRADDVNFYGNGNGILIKSGSTVEVFGGTINNNLSDNVYCLESTYKAFNATHNSSTNGSGVVLDCGSRANLSNCKSNNNKLWGVAASLGSVLKANSNLENTGNISGGYTPAFGTVGNGNSIISN